MAITYNADHDVSTGSLTHPAPPREHEEDLWRFLEQLRDESERVRNEEGKFQQLDHLLKLFLGSHWPDQLPSWRPPIVANELHTLLLSDVNDLTESEPRIFVTRNNQQQDTMVERAIRAVWTRNHVSLELMSACLWARALGTGFMECVWDPNNADGRGDALVRHRDPRHVYPDPDAIDDQHWLFVIKALPLDIVDIRRLWPISGMRVRPDDSISEKDPRHRASPISGAVTPVYLGPIFGGGSIMGAPMGYKKARAEVIDCLIVDDTPEETVEEEKGPDGIPIRDEQGRPKLRVTRGPKYPHGRRIVGANKVILFDGDNPNVSGDFGLVRIVLEPTLGRFWGSGWIAKTGEMQMAANKGLSSIVENALRLNNGIIDTTTNTGVDWESFSGMPAQIVQRNPGSEFKIIYPPPMPDSMVQFPFQMLDMQKRVLGFSGSRSGEAGAGNRSAELTETEISQSQSTTRLANRMLYFAVLRLAKMIFARIAQGYTTRRVIPSVEGESMQFTEWTPMEKPSEYAIHVDPASFQVLSKTMLKRLALASYKLKLIDRQAALEMLGIPNSKEIADRLNRQDAISQYYKEAGRKAGRGR